MSAPKPVPGAALRCPTCRQPLAWHDARKIVACIKKAGSGDKLAR